MTGFALKLIAICSMLLDHTMKVLPFQTLLMDWFHMSIKDSYLLYQILEPFGRLAFPIFAFSSPRAAAIPAAPKNTWAGCCCSA